MPDSEVGELAQAWVVVKPGRSLTASSITDWVQGTSQAVMFSLSWILIIGDEMGLFIVESSGKSKPDLAGSGAQKFYYREIRGPIDINNAPGDISRISQGP